MTLAVVTATRTAPPSLEETVRSVAASLPEARHVVVGPSALAVPVARRFPHVVFVAESGNGLYAALNDGLGALGDAEAFTWLNDDDVLSPEGTPAALRALAAASVDIVYGRVRLADAAGRRLGEIPVARRPADLPALLASGIMPLAQPGTWVRREVLAAVPRFDESYRLAGDLDFYVRALRAGVAFGFVDAEVARFRLHAGQLSKQEAEAAHEHARAVAGLSAVPSTGARWRFRCDNLPVYLERVRRHGFVSMRTLYRHG